MEWLRQIGCDGARPGISEEEAIRLAVPLENPGSPGMESIERIVIHHSATETGNASCFRVLHRMINGWNDIGYHFVIGNGSFSTDGEIEQGRSLPFRGAHAKGGNENSIGICLVGNFNSSSPSALQMESLGFLIKKLMTEFSIQAAGVTLHRLVSGSNTECPGKHVTMPDVLHLINNE
jgi:N-acetyl-anhydromuramyl-L-alanine amidase AmpD